MGRMGVASDSNEQDVRLFNDTLPLGCCMRVAKAHEKAVAVAPSLAYSHTRPPCDDASTGFHARHVLLALVEAICSFCN